MSTQNESISYDVVVVGAGPSGLATAVAATRAGARVLVVERHQSTSTFPKATGVRPRTMEILRSWGLEHEVWAGGADLRLAAAVSATLADRQQQDFSLGIPQPETLAVLSPSVTAISPQDHLEPVLLAHLRSLGGDVRFHTELVGLDQHDEGVSVRVRAVDDGAEERIEARYVVGADGAGSAVRRTAGIEERSSVPRASTSRCCSTVRSRSGSGATATGCTSSPRPSRACSCRRGHRAGGSMTASGRRSVTRGASLPWRTTRPRSGWLPGCPISSP